MLIGEKDKKILFIMNPRAGTMQATKHLAEIIQVYSDQGYETTVLMTKASGDAKKFAMKYSEYADITVCAGGDGTLNEVIDGIITAGKGSKIGYIPAGSTNDFATSVGLPKSIMGAARIPVTGEARTFDIGSFNGRCFSYVASFGAFSDTSYKVPQNIKNILGHSAYILQGIKDVMSIKPIHVEVIADPDTPDEKSFEGNYILGSICNSTMVGGVLKLDKFDIDMNDGMMEVLLVEAPRNPVELTQLAASMLDRTLKSERIKFFSAKNIRLKMPENTHWTLDGEYESGSENIEIKTMHSAIQLII